MRCIFAYDTETTGIPDWKSPSGAEHQPHIVQLGAVLADLDSRKIIKTLDLIIKPDGWTIPQETIDVHGITNEQAMDEGIPEDEALNQLLSLWGGHLRVAHNRTFDQRIVRIACKRYSTEAVTEAWADKDSHECSMLMAKPIMQLTPKNRYGFKPPKLEEAYRFFTGNELQNAHSALPDAMGCLEVYFGIQDHLKKAA
ncbi:3'-5' exonuclease [Hahella ganghwensis]|uniref:3'-5' exonuclease n=1 Tax=Hahella ganghwensis TaxID=286420 RepID=UPI000367DE38|nr:3'-5' exonuclease [Hahella ganghwensis]